MRGRPFERQGHTAPNVMNSLLTKSMNSGSQALMIRKIVREELKRTG